MSIRTIRCSCQHTLTLSNKQEPVRAMSRRLVTLLAEFPEHPVLSQLMAICSRCLGLPAASMPLKTALTGLELLLARAQVCVYACVCLCVFVCALLLCHDAREREDDAHSLTTHTQTNSHKLTHTHTHALKHAGVGGERRQVREHRDRAQRHCCPRHTLA